MTAQPQSLQSIATALMGSPLAMEPGALSAFFAAREGFTAEHELAGGFSEVMGDGVAVIQVQGTLVSRDVGARGRAFGLTSYAQITRELEAAVAEPSVKGVLLDIHCGGGEVHGCFETAARIREATKTKPVYAVANSAAYSGAYALASAATRVYVPQTGGVGSIGVLFTHRDMSKAAQEQGVSYTLIRAGARKAEFHPAEPLTDDARLRAQAEADRLYGIFAETVAGHGRLSLSEVMATEAATFHGDLAVEAGLADELGNYEDARRALSKHNRRTRRPMASSPFGRGGADHGA